MAAALSGATLWGTARAHNSTFLLESLGETDSFITHVTHGLVINNVRSMPKNQIFQDIIGVKCTKKKH